VAAFDSTTLYHSGNPQDPRQLFVAFLESFLNIKFQGLQSGFGVRPDSILFEGPSLVSDNPVLNGKPTTLAVPVGVMLLPREMALGVVEAKRLAANSLLANPESL
jgi:hypothetical protein